MADQPEGLSAGPTGVEETPTGIYRLAPNPTAASINWLTASPAYGVSFSADVYMEVAQIAKTTETGHADPGEQTFASERLSYYLIAKANVPYWPTQLPNQ